MNYKPKKERMKTAEKIEPEDIPQLNQRVHELKQNDQFQADAPIA